jgi:hypothetical protein
MSVILIDARSGNFPFALRTATNSAMVQFVSIYFIVCLTFPFSSFYIFYMANFYLLVHSNLMRVDVSFNAYLRQRSVRRESIAARNAMR